MLPTVTAAALAADADASSAVSIVVVDPRFDAYKALAAAARLGRCALHLRGSGRAALQLLSKRPVEAVIVGAELDDMTGQEFVALLRARHAEGASAAGMPVVIMAAPVDGPQPAADQSRPASGCDGTQRAPITLGDVEDQVFGRFRRRRGAGTIAGLLRVMATLPVGVTVAAIAVAVLLLR